MCHVRSRLAFVSFSTLVLVCVPLSLYVFGQSPGKTGDEAINVVRWEYREIPYNRGLLGVNALGQEGWELVSVCQNDKLDLDHPTMIFKRRLK